MMGVLQASKDIPIMPLEDEMQDAENAVVSILISFPSWRQVSQD